MWCERCGTTEPPFHTSGPRSRAARHRPSPATAHKGSSPASGVFLRRNSLVRSGGSCTPRRDPASERRLPGKNSAHRHATPGLHGQVPEAERTQRAPHRKAFQSESVRRTHQPAQNQNRRTRARGDKDAVWGNTMCPSESVRRAAPLGLRFLGYWKRTSWRLAVTLV